MPGRRAEVVLGLVVPLGVLGVLVALALSGSSPDVAIAFMACVPLLAAMATRALLTGIVAVITVLAASVTAAVSHGQHFADALPVLLGVIVAAGVAVLASQARPTVRPGPRAASPPTAPPRAAGPLEPEATTDDLTGLPTRVGARRDLAGANTDGPRVLAVIDCDRLAAINDEYGRAIGDTFLFAVAGRTRYALPEGDLVARWDGEEFLACISGTLDDVRPTLELITDKVNRNPIRTDAGLIPATMSVGAAAWPEGGDFDEALGRARRALYRAKADGAARLAVE